MEDANSRGPYVYRHFLLTFLFISMTVHTHTSRLFCMAKPKGNSLMIRGLIVGKQWEMFPNWVGFGDAWPNDS